MKKLILILFILILSFGVAWGAGIVLKIPENGLTNWDNSDLNPNYTGTYTDATNIEFFSGGVPGPLEITGRFAPNYTRLGGPPVIHQYDDTTRTGNVYIRSWDTREGRMPRARGSYYGITEPPYAAAAGSQPANQYDVTRFKTEYLAELPRQPSVLFDREYLDRSGTDYVLRLSINISYDEGTPKIQTSGHSDNGGRKYRVKVWKDTESQPGDDAAVNNINVFATDGSIQFPTGELTRLTPGARYHFRAQAWNWFGHGEYGPQLDWPTLSGGGPMTESFNLVKKLGGLGLNTIYMPFTSTDPSVTNWDLLIRGINGTAINPATGTAPYATVQVIGRYIPGDQKWVGFIVSYPTSDPENMTFTRINIDKDPLDLPVARQDVFWVSVRDGTTFSITGTR
jgi:hypothetical protein